MAGDRLRIVMSSIMRRRRGLNSAISLLLFQRLRFNSRNPSKQKRHPQTDPPNAASAASFNRKTELQENSAQIPLILQFQSPNPPGSPSQINGLRIVHGRHDLLLAGGNLTPADRTLEKPTSASSISEMEPLPASIRATF